MSEMGGKPRARTAAHAARRAKAAGANTFQTDERLQGRMAIGYLPVEEARRIGMPVLGEFSAATRGGGSGEKWAELMVRVRAMLDTVADVVAAQEGNFEATESVASQINETLHSIGWLYPEGARAAASRRAGENSSVRLSDEEREMWEYAGKFARSIELFRSALRGACAKWNPFGRDSADAPLLFRELIREAARYLRGDAPHSLTDALPSFMRELGYSGQQIRAALRLDGDALRQRERRARRAEQVQKSG